LWVTGSTGFGFSLSRVISGSRAHRRSRRRRPLVSSAPPIEGSDSISLNSPDLISLSISRSPSISRSLSLFPPQSPDLSLSLSFSLCESLRQQNKEEERRKGEEEERRRKKEKKRKKERDPVMQGIREKMRGKLLKCPPH
jgi:hypothetical protein